MLPRIFGAGQLAEFAQAAAAEAHEKWEEGKIAGLESLMRVKEILEKLRMLLDNFVAAIESGARFRAQFFHLVPDALLGARDGALDGRVHFTDGFVQIFDSLFNLTKAAVKRARQLLP